MTKVYNMSTVLDQLRLFMAFNKHLCKTNKCCFNEPVAIGQFYGTIIECINAPPLKVRFKRKNLCDGFLKDCLNFADDSIYFLDRQRVFFKQQWQIRIFRRKWLPHLCHIYNHGHKEQTQLKLKWCCYESPPPPPNVHGIQFCQAVRLKGRRPLCVIFRCNMAEDIFINVIATCSIIQVTCNISV